VETPEGQRGFHLPTCHALINDCSWTWTRQKWKVVSENAVSVRPAPAGAAEKPIRFELVLAPVEPAWVAWKPRSRDTRLEKAVFYAELFQLFVPTAGIIEGCTRRRFAWPRANCARWDFERRKA